MIVPILYEDNHILVVNKPYNMPVQLDSSKDLDLLNFLKGYIKEKYNKPGNVYLGLVHRLDRPAGGVMVFARTSKAASRLSEQIKKRSFIKRYMAVVCGNIGSGTMEDFISKDPVTFSSKIEKTGDYGKKATLEYETVGNIGELSLVNVKLHTGRHHQIRIQFASRGCPLWGDARYNSESKPGQQLALFSSEIGFVHPTTKEQLSFSTKLPSTVPWNMFER